MKAFGFWVFTKTNGQTEKTIHWVKSKRDEVVDVEETEKWLIHEEDDIREIEASKAFRVLYCLNLTR
ncbi:hypothetical protein GBA52_009349 [Prunus armeniaca]|nr:hypothetical protein GBA52_009349 [Prunus armeniaca]